MCQNLQQVTRNRYKLHGGDNQQLHVVSRREELRRAVIDAQQAGHTVGLVPTMGALHEGHLSLIDAAQAECDLTAVTIFVNPAQFGPNEDLDAYPRNLDADLAELQRRGCDLVFVPSVEEMYPPGYDTYVDAGVAARVLEGRFRPTHFRGVATVVLKLLLSAPADRAYFGQKDYQQTIVVRQIVADLGVPIDIRVCPTVREPDGLAMSSRNAYLSEGERQRAAVLYESLQMANRLAAEGQRNVAVLRRQMEQRIQAIGGVDVQYIAFVERGTVTAVDAITGPTVVAIAAMVGQTRLIDNCIIE